MLDKSRSEGRPTEQAGQLDPPSLALQSVGVFIGSQLYIAGKLPAPQIVGAKPAVGRVH
jgi:hypothetical protein